MTAFDDLSLLRTFVCIVECGSISAAARRLKNPQPTLSRHLRLLEEHCGVALLRRDTHRMSLTEAGQRLLTDAQTMLAHAQEADQRLREGQTTLSGHLRLFATIDLGQSIVTRLVSRFLQANPKVTAELGLSSRPCT
jgi:DNA-binding transcriptional LysR family regulator